MRKRPQPTTRQLQQGAARQELRKAGNTLSHAIRLGKVPHTFEVDRGECATERCSVEGRMFSVNVWVPDPDVEGAGAVYSDLKGRCVMCTSQMLGVTR